MPTPPQNLAPIVERFAHLLNREDLKAQTVATIEKGLRIRDPKAIQKCHAIGHCEACGTTDNWEAHHVKTRGAGGDDTMDNLVSLCRNCHRAAHGGKLTKRFLFGLIAKRGKR